MLGLHFIVAVKADRGLPDFLDNIEDVPTFLVPDGVAENAAKQPDIIAQRGIFV